MLLNPVLGRLLSAETIDGDKQRDQGVHCIGNLNFNAIANFAATTFLPFQRHVAHRTDPPYRILPQRRLRADPTAVGIDDDFDVPESPADTKRIDR